MAPVRASQSISDATARRFFPDGNVIGHTLVVSGDTWQIVGVIADVVDRRLDAVRGAFAYVPQVFNTSQLSVVVRTPLDPESLLPVLRREIARLDAGVALANPRALDRAMAGSMTQRKVVLALVGVFAATALVLASVGLYGVLAYAVATRRRELGIRFALGAVQSDIMRGVIRRRPPGDGGRPARRLRRGHRCGQAARERAVSGDEQRSDRVGRHGRDRRDRGGAGLRDSGLARGTFRSHRRPA